MMHVGDADESRRLALGGGELTDLAVEGVEIAGDAKIPGAGLGGREANDHAAAAVPEGGKQERAVTRGAELGVDLDGFVRIRMGRHLGFPEIEDDLARRKCGSGATDGLRVERESGEKE